MNDDDDTAEVPRNTVTDPLFVNVNSVRFGLPSTSCVAEVETDTAVFVIRDMVAP